MYPVPRDAASVILLRPGQGGVIRGGFQVFLLRRQKKSSFMPSAFVFPGGAAEPTDTDLRVTAARELFEEAGVLIARDQPRDPAEIAALRTRVLDGATDHGLVFDPSAFHPWSHWITPSIEPKRFSARFFVAVLPPGQEPTFDDRETVEQVWVTAAEAIVRAKELALPPPQVRTFWELSRVPAIEDVIAESARRNDELAPIMPRVAPGHAGGVCLLLPWDPDYDSAGQGDASPMPTPPRWATGRSRFLLEDQTWRHVVAPASTPAAS
jgi:8-oxo-dGTP pyrophosphatase MutT (NUDIX family)